MKINQIIEEWRNEDIDALDYEGQQNKDGNGDLNVDRNMQENILSVTNFIQPYLHQFSIDSHGLNGYGKPLKRPFDRYQSRLEAISIGRDIRQINW